MEFSMINVEAAIEHADKAGYSFVGDLKLWSDGQTVEFTAIDCIHIEPVLCIVTVVNQGEVGSGKLFLVTHAVEV